jgi:protein-arginine kinase activator protein McsA
MNKEHLLEAICKALNIDMHEHHAAKLENKGRIKTKIKLLKRDRDKAIEDKDYVQLKKIRKEIKKLKNELRKALA